MLLTAGLAGRATTRDLLPAAMIMLVCHAVSHLSPVRVAVLAVRRTRWLLFSVLCTYALFTPGVPLWPGLGTPPSVEGIGEGARHAAALVIIVGMVHWLSSTTPREGLLAGLVFLLEPLLGLRLSQRLALRLGLTFEALDDAFLSARAAPAVTGAGRVERWCRRATDLFERALTRADNGGATEFAFERVSRPGWYEWILPAGLTLLLLTVHLAP